MPDTPRTKAEILALLPSGLSAIDAQDLRDLVMSVYNIGVADGLLPTDGTVAMGGSLDLGANNITNVGLVDGRDVSADGVAGGVTAANLAVHISDVANPHGVTATQVGADPLRMTIPAAKTVGFAVAGQTTDGARVRYRYDSATGGTLTADAGTIGDRIEVRQVGAGQVTIAPGTGVTLAAPPAAFSKTASNGALTAQAGSTIVLTWVTATLVEQDGDMALV